MKKHSTPTADSISRLILQLQKLEKQPHSFGAAGPLTPSEIHTIDAIGPEGGVLMSVLADRLHVTKGAVTQIITRLEHKQLVQRNPNPADSRSVLVFLTETGLKALLVHDEMQEAMYRELSANLDDNEMKILEKGLETLCRHLQRD